MTLLDKNIKIVGTLEQFRTKAKESMFDPVHCKDLCLMPQEDLQLFKKSVIKKTGKRKSMANKFVTLTGAS